MKLKLKSRERNKPYLNGRWHKVYAKPGHTEFHRFDKVLFKPDKLKAVITDVVPAPDGVCCYRITALPGEASFPTYGNDLILLKRSPIKIYKTRRNVHVIQAQCDLLSDAAAGNHSRSKRAHRIAVGLHQQEGQATVDLPKLQATDAGRNNDGAKQRTVLPAARLTWWLGYIGRWVHLDFLSEADPDIEVQFWNLVINRKIKPELVSLEWFKQPKEKEHENIGTGDVQSSRKQHQSGNGNDCVVGNTNRPRKRNCKGSRSKISKSSSQCIGGHWPALPARSVSCGVRPIAGFRREMKKTATGRYTRLIAVKPNATKGKQHVRKHSASKVRAKD